jgi:hypothetical protein
MGIHCRFHHICERPFIEMIAFLFQEDAFRQYPKGLTLIILVLYGTPPEVHPPYPREAVALDPIVCHKQLTLRGDYRKPLSGSAVRIIESKGS